MTHCSWCVWDVRMWCLLWLECVVLAEPGSLSSWEIRDFSGLPWLVCGSEQQLEESRGQGRPGQC